MTQNAETAEENAERKKKKKEREEEEEEMEIREGVHQGKKKKKKPETVVGRGATWSRAATWVAARPGSRRDLGRGAT